MDPRNNPYAPGAGTPPPELAGRKHIIDAAAISFDRLRAGRPERSIIFYGLRGVGKTVLLNEICKDAEKRGFTSIWLETPEDRSLPSLLVPALRTTLIRLNRGQAFKAGLGRSMKALAGFAKALKVTYQDIQVGVDFESEQGLADSGELEIDLIALLENVALAAKERKTAIVLAIDELQYLPEEQLRALIAALHRLNQQDYPLTIVGAGLPQLVGQAGRAKSYAERLFNFLRIDKLDPSSAEDALCKPAARENVRFTQGAVEEILRQTEGYPYFLQEWGKESWELADASPINESVARRATVLALAKLDESFFRVRFDRISPAEKRYLRAMAQIGPGPHRSGDIAEKLGKTVNAVAPYRATLINKGMIYSPAHGDTAFTVPLFDGFMRRIMPD